MNIPILFTFWNLICGVLAIVLSFLYPEDIRYFSFLLIIALLCDVLDGRIARKLEQTSSLWAYLDSLSDIISFGLAPALLIIFEYKKSNFPDSMLRVMILIVCLFVCCGAWRLARFHTIIEQDPSKKVPYYLGMPITINGIVFPLWFFLEYQINSTYHIPLTVILLILSWYSMVSTHKFPKW